MCSQADPSSPPPVRPLLLRLLLHPPFLLFYLPPPSTTSLIDLACDGAGGDGSLGGSQQVVISSRVNANGKRRGEHLQQERVSVCLGGGGDRVGGGNRGGGIERRALGRGWWRGCSVAARHLSSDPSGDITAGVREGLQGSWAPAVPGGHFSLSLSLSLSFFFWKERGNLVWLANLAAADLVFWRNPRQAGIFNWLLDLSDPLFLTFTALFGNHSQMAHLMPSRRRGPCQMRFDKMKGGGRDARNIQVIALTFEQLEFPTENKNPQNSLFLSFLLSFSPFLSSYPMSLFLFLVTDWAHVFFCINFDLAFFAIHHTKRTTDNHKLLSSSTLIWMIISHSAQANLYNSRLHLSPPDTSIVSPISATIRELYPTILTYIPIT